MCGGDCSSVQKDLVGVQSVVASDASFAALTRDGKVVAWGDPWDGGDCSSVKAELVGVQRVIGTGCAFAALTIRGTVVAWGHTLWGGDCSSEQHLLVDVVSLKARPDHRGFTALTRAGAAVTWGGVSSS